MAWSDTSASEWGRDCPETAYGYHSRAETNGRCRYCGRKYVEAAPRPSRWTWSRMRSALDEAYARTYDPDWGSGAYDSDPC
jgi:hypothetical protein